MSRLFERLGAFFYRLTWVFGFSRESVVTAAQRDLIRHRELNNLFHKTLAAMTGNLTLVKTMERLDTQVSGHQLQCLPFMRDENLKISQHDHEEIFEAVSSGDGDKAELFMRRHLKSGLKFALACFPNGS